MSIQEKISVLVNLVQPHLPEIKMGYFGTFAKEKIDLSSLIDEAIRRYKTTEEQLNFVLKKMKVWQTIFEQHNQYIINYFMAKAMQHSNETSSYFWEDYNIDEQKYSTEKCLAIFTEKYDAIVKNELSAYLAKDTTKDIKTLFIKHFPFFAYDEFIASIRLRYLGFSVSDFTIELSDKQTSVFCSACERFDKNFEPHEWHNF